MKRFIVRALFFGAIIILGCLALELVLLFKGNEYSYKREYVENHADAIKVLVLGHSHAACGINAEIMGDSVYNFAMDGRQQYYDAVIAQRYLHTMPNLRVVIWPYGYGFEYNSYRYSHDKDHLNLQYMHYYQCMYEKYMHISYESYIPYWHWPEMLYNSFDFSFESLIQHDSEAKNDEKLAMPEKAVDWQHGHLPAKIDYSAPIARKAFQESLGYFKQIAQACKDENVRLIVVGFPYYKTARDLVTARGLKDKQMCLDSMRAVYPQMEYYEFMDDDRFVDDDFLDATHLNSHGAKKFSLIIKDILDKSGKN
jgi:hypothetical protein